MENGNFEAYAFIGYDRENYEYTEDYPHEIIARIDGNIETWKTRLIGHWFLKYYCAKSEPYTRKTWHMRLAESEANDATYDLSREEFEHYAYSGLMFG